MKKVQGRVYERIWREKCDYIIISNLLKISLCISIISALLIVIKPRRNFYDQK